MKLVFVEGTIYIYIYVYGEEQGKNKNEKRKIERQERESLNQFFTLSSVVYISHVYPIILVSWFLCLPLKYSTE